jgi:crotonobetainyl-CoA:carnitine CoA-transferase CaiB-like acyl-CoA transferase
MVFNPLVNNYETSDHRWLALCMLQPDLYYEGLVRALGRDDMVSDERFATPEARTANGGAIVDELRKTFAELSLAEARQALGSQRGQWDVVNRAIDLLDDPQGIANGFVQSVDYGDGRTLPMFTTPVHFDRDAPVLTPAPEFGADTDEILASIGMDTDAILQAKIDGGVV